MKALFCILLIGLIVPFSFGYNTPKEAKIDSLNEQALELRNINKAKSLELALRIYKESNDLNYKLGIASCLNTLGLLYLDYGKYEKAKEHFLKSKEVRIELKDTLALGRILNNIGMLERINGNSDLAFESLFEALKIHEESNSSASMGKTFDNIASVYEGEGDLQQAADYYHKALKVYTQIKDTLLIANSNYGIANLYYQTDQLKNAYTHALESQRYYHLAKNWEGEADILNILAAVAWDNDDLDKAEAHFKEGIDIYKKNKDQSLGLVDLYTNLGIIKVEQGKPREGLTELYEARRLLKDKGSFWDRIYLYQNFAEAHETLAQFDSAYHYQAITRTMEDSLYQLEKTEAIAEMQTKYETERKEKELVEEKLLSQKYASQRSLLFQLLLASLVILGLLYFFFRHRQKTARIITQQKAKIHEQEVEELLQEQELKMVNAALEGQEVERKRIAKDLHDRLGSMLTTLKWRFDGILEKEEILIQKEPLEEANQMLDEAYHEVRRIAHDMNSGVLAKFGLIPALEELAASLEKGGGLKVEILKYGLGQRLDSPLEIICYRIIQELVGNVLKHAQATSLSIQVSRMEDELQISVEDNGRGFDPEKIHEGMGLKNIEARLQGLNGKLEIDSGKGGGTGIFIDLPV